MNSFQPYFLDAWDWDGIPVIVDPVVQQWTRLIAAAAPWCDMRRDDTSGYMRGVVSEMLNESRHPDGSIRTTRLEASARKHGQFRRAQRVDGDSLEQEFHILARATEIALLSVGMRPHFVQDALIVLDSDLKLARTAAVAGWRESDR